MKGRSVLEWLCFAAFLYFVGGPPGLLVAVAIGWYLLLKLDGKILIGIGAALFAGVPLMMLINGLTNADDLQPQIVGTYATSNNLAFAGLVCLAVGVLLSVREQIEPEASEAHDRPRGAMADEVATAVIDEGSVSMSIAQVDDIDLYLTLTGEEESGQIPEQATRRSLLTGAGWMAVFVVTQSVTGIGFWLLSSRFYPTATVGLASALFSLLLLVTFVTGMGLPVTIPLFAGGTDRESTTLLTWALIYTTATSAVGTVLFLLVVKSDATTLLREEGGALGWLIFFVSVAGASIASLVDVRLMGARRWSLVFARSLVVGVGRIALLFMPKVGNGALWLFSVGSLPVAISGVFAIAVLPGAAKIKYHLWPLPSRTFAAFRFASINFTATLSSQAPTFILPVIVLANVPPEANAQYFLAWSAASVVFLFPTTIAQVLLVESSGSRQVDPVQARLRYLEALGLSLGIAVVALIVTVLLKGFVQTIFGAAYSGTSALLPLLVGAGIPWTFTAISLTRARLRKDSRAIIATTATLGIVTIGAALVLVPREGTVGAAVAWLIGQTIAAAVALLFDWLWTSMPPRKHRIALDADAVVDDEGIVTEPAARPLVASSVAAAGVSSREDQARAERRPPAEEVDTRQPPPAPARTSPTASASAAPVAPPPPPVAAPPPVAPGPPAVAPLPPPTVAAPPAAPPPPPPSAPAAGAGSAGRKATRPPAPVEQAPPPPPPSTRPPDDAPTRRRRGRRAEAPTENWFADVGPGPEDRAPKVDPAFEQGLDRAALVEALFGSAGPPPTGGAADSSDRPAPPDEGPV